MSVIWQPCVIHKLAMFFTVNSHVSHMPAITISHTQPNMVHISSIFQMHKSTIYKPHISHLVRWILDPCHPKVNHVSAIFQLHIYLNLTAFQTQFIPISVTCKPYIRRILFTCHPNVSHFAAKCQLHVIQCNPHAIHMSVRYLIEKTAKLSSLQNNKTEE